MTSVAGDAAAPAASVEPQARTARVISERFMVAPSFGSDRTRLALTRAVPHPRRPQIRCRHSPRRPSALPQALRRLGMEDLMWVLVEPSRRSRRLRIRAGLLTLRMHKARRSVVGGTGPPAPVHAR